MMKTWSGPALAAIGAAVLAAIELLPSTAQSPLDLVDTNQRAEPGARAAARGIGRGARLGRLSFRIAALAMFGIGIAAALSYRIVSSPRWPRCRRRPVTIFYRRRCPAAVGLALGAGRKAAAWILPAASVIAGAMLVFAIRVTDPSLHNLRLSDRGHFDRVLDRRCVALTVHAFRRDWFAIPGRIIGSWLIAIGLLYGGTSLIPKRSLPAPPIAATPQAPLPGFERDVPGMPAPEQGSGLPAGSLPQ